MSDEEIYISVTIASILSLLGCSVIIILYFACKELQGFAFKLITYLSLLDLLHCIVFILPTYDSASNEPICILQSYLLTIITLESVIWTLIICIFIYLSVVKKLACDCYVTKTFVLLSFFCIFISLVPFTTSNFSNYASRLGWCWLKSDFYKFVLLYIPLWIIFFVNTAIYVIVIKTLRCELDGFEDTDVKKSIIRKLRFYPVLLIVSFTPVTILRITQFMNHKPHEALIILSGVFTCLNGCFNFVVYGCTQQVRKILINRRKLIFYPRFLDEDL